MKGYVNRPFLAGNERGGYWVAIESTLRSHIKYNNDIHDHSQRPMITNNLEQCRVKAQSQWALKCLW